MQKEETPNIKYSGVVGGKKESITDIIKRTFPETMIPTKKTGWIFGVIFLAVVLIGIFTFPLGKLLSGNADIVVEIGFPWAFLIFNLLEPEQLPLKIGPLLIDILIYIVIAYTIDVAINSFSKAMGKKYKKSKRPDLYNIPQKQATAKIAEQAAIKTQKVISKK